MYCRISSRWRMRDDRYCANDSNGTGETLTAVTDGGTAATRHQSIWLSIALSARLFRWLRQCDRRSAPGGNAI